MSNITKYLPYAGLTIISICSIIYIVGKRINNIVSKNVMPKLKQRQSTVHNIVKNVLPTNQEIIKNIIGSREKLKQTKQSMQNYNAESIKVIVIENKAYWIQDNTFYETVLTEDGEIDQSFAKPVDTSNLDVEAVNGLMKIVDNLRGIDKNDGSGTGN